MSKISLATNAVGTAIFTIESPGTSTNRTLTLPDDTGTIVTNSGNQAGSFTTLNTSGAVVFNDAGADVDFRVEGDTNQNLLFVDASREAVGVGVAPSAWGLGLGLVGLDIGAAGHVLGTGATVNSGANCYYDGSAWKYKTSTYANYYEQNSNNTGVHAWFIAPSGTAGNTATFTQAMTLDASGNVGIGVTPEAWDTNFKALQIGATAALVYFPSSSQTVLYNNTYYSSGDKRLIDGSASYYSQVSGAHFWGIAGSGLADSAISFTSAMTLDSSGRLLVGYSSVVSGFPAGTVAASGYATKAGSSAGINTSANVFNIDWTGSANLYIDTTNIGAIQTSSDYRIKRNIETQTQSALERITQLRPVTYQRADYGTLFQADDVVREGFIAHELAEVIPSAVEGEKDAEDQIQSLKLDALCSVMVKAIQELKAELDTVKAELATLKG